MALRYLIFPFVSNFLSLSSMLSLLYEFSVKRVLRCALCRCIRDVLSPFNGKLFVILSLKSLIVLFASLTSSSFVFDLSVNVQCCANACILKFLHHGFLSDVSDINSYSSGPKQLLVGSHRRLFC